MSTDIVVVRAGKELEQRELVEQFYRDVYLPVFAHQREPLETWLDVLADPAPPYELAIVLALDGDRVIGGQVVERYPQSGCGFLTYIAVAPAARGRGLGQALVEAARVELATRARQLGQEPGLVVFEIADPDRVAPHEVAEARRRLAWFEQLGARVLDIAYVQPDLGAGQGRDRHLLLMGFVGDPPPPHVPGGPIATFVRELYTITEGTIDAATAAWIDAIGERVRVRTRGTSPTRPAAG